jgi:hypothetical protein
MQSALEQEVRNLLGLRPNCRRKNISNNKLCVAAFETRFTRSLLRPLARDTSAPSHQMRLLVQRLGVGGGGGDVGVTGSLVGAGGLLEVLGSLHVSLLGVVVAVLK